MSKMSTRGPALPGEKLVVRLAPGCPVPRQDQAGIRRYRTRPSPGTRGPGRARPGLPRARTGARTPRSPRAAIRRRSARRGSTENRACRPDAPSRMRRVGAGSRRAPGSIVIRHRLPAISSRAARESRACIRPGGDAQLRDAPVQRDLAPPYREAAEERLDARAKDLEGTSYPLRRDLEALQAGSPLEREEKTKLDTSGGRRQGSLCQHRFPLTQEGERAFPE